MSSPESSVEGRELTRRESRKVERIEGVKESGDFKRDRGKSRGKMR